VTEPLAKVPQFLVVAPVGRDGDLICALLDGAGYSSQSVRDVGEVEKVDSALLRGLILTDEALLHGGIETFHKLMHAQPVWSDLPSILLTSSATEPGCAVLARRARTEVRSLILLDRPVRKEMLINAVQAAFTSREKQLQIRDAAERQFQSDEALRKTERLAVAGQLAATMAHEVNNPLEALGNLLFLIENTDSLEDAHSFGHIAAQEFHRISEIIDHTLRFHRAPANPAFTDVSELAISALALFRGKLHERMIRERITAEHSYGYCNEGEVRQALVNLIGNAADAMRDGGGCLRIHVSQVSIKGVEHARITVADTGTGIRKEIRGNLFSQFFTTKGSSGTGIGLWLTREILQRYGGKIRFRSRTEPPTGTVFVMYIPSVPPIAERLQSTAGQGHGEGTVAALM
jgi:signal transduction histidine kinase